MKDKNALIHSTLAGLLALGATITSTTVQAVAEQPKIRKKCAGITKRV